MTTNAAKILEELNRADNLNYLYSLKSDKVLEALCEDIVLLRDKIIELQAEIKALSLHCKTEST